MNIGPLKCHFMCHGKCERTWDNVARVMTQGIVAREMTYNGHRKRDDLWCSSHERRPMVIITRKIEDAHRKRDDQSSSCDELFKHKVSSMVMIVHFSCDDPSSSCDKLSILSMIPFVAREMTYPSFCDEQFVAREMKCR
jgi:hypothetical protein